MSDMDRNSHLSDTTIRLYWRDQLSEHEERHVEEHYLECLGCQRRVYAAEEQQEDPRPVPGRSHGRWWQWTTAAVAVVALGGLAWQQVSTRGAGTPTPSASDATRALVHLSPPTRDSAVTAVDAPSPSVIVFVLDAREAGGAGTTFNVTLSESSGRPILRESGLRASTDGEVRVPVDAALLNAGSHVFELTGGAVPIGFPFVVRK